jgi:hypothetical protein
MCLSPCTGTTAATAFLLTGAAAGASVLGTGDGLCTYDFLAIPGGQNQASFAFSDRYCGGTFPASVCSKFDFRIIWVIRRILLTTTIYYCSCSKTIQNELRH